MKMWTGRIKKDTNKIADDFKNQKQELRKVLRNEFGKNKQPAVSEPSKGVKFEIEWDEDK